MKRLLKAFLSTTVKEYCLTTNLVCGDHEFPEVFLFVKVFTFTEILFEEIFSVQLLENFLIMLWYLRFVATNYL
ncbi:CLUMA_CG014619, isoform A [Clunio marinus]|uniref:CLUMA_CG014619, isoform A n=1 Tax=Clunio marinus TaxID=568069 RepID=A0A1J1ISB9_9DIPT|nr:CLUMA_CG014619, isoform A [Clunio marinus]